MKKLLIMLGVATALSSVKLTFPVEQTGNEPLFRIVEKDRTGYINAAGKEIIEPKFNSAAEFSEGLAAARMQGSYGYIDQTGNYVIAPAYDYATNFSEGLAIVYRNGKPFYIDKAGKEPFEVNFAGIEPFENGLARVRTSSRKTGFINKQGKLVIDTLYSYIGKFNNGLAVIQAFRKNKNNEDAPMEEERLGVINRQGNFIVPFGKYSSIIDFNNGYARIEIPSEKGDEKGLTMRSGLINEKGELIFSMDRKNYSYLDGNVHEGLVKVYFSKLQPGENPDNSNSDDLTYQGFINLKGEVVIKDTLFEYVNDFSENRAFVKDKDQNHFLINNKGKLVTIRKFQNVLGEGFKNGIAFVETDSGWGAIDLNGNFLIEPTFENIEYPGLIGDFFFFSESRENNTTLYGLANKNGSIIIEPQLEQFSMEGFKNGLLAAQKDKKLCYLNTKGETVWQEKSGSGKTQNLNIDFMNRGYFSAFSSPTRKNNDELGGYAASINYPQKITTKNKFTANKLSVIAQPENKTPWAENYNGFKLLIVNNTKNDIEFDAQDSRIGVKLQALDRDGKRKAIEYLPHSWCGNSYHTVTLDARHFWSFTVPVYEGDFKTKLRAELTYPDPADDPKKAYKEERQQKEITIYSNEFAGSVNPGQFWRRREYFPAGIMDPYNE